MRIESSIITSLSELRAIEQQRIADERAVIERARVEEIEARRAAERARIEAEETRVRTEREEARRIEQRRFDAERDARLKVQAAEAAERARLHAALEHERMHQEVELRRAEIAKQRPRWMLVVTGAAMVVAIGLGWYAIDRNAERNRADDAAHLALKREEQAKQGTAQVRRDFDRLVSDMAVLDDKVAQAETALRKAQGEADRKRAAEIVAQAKLEKAEAQKRKDELAVKLWKQKRNEKVIISDECKRNPLAKGCDK